MEKYVLPVSLIYFAAISLVALFVTVYDKWAAKKRPKHRTPERTLLIISAADARPWAEEEPRP